MATSNTLTPATANNLEMLIQVLKGMGIDAKKTVMQRGHIGLKHAADKAVQVRYTAKKLGFGYMLAEKFNTIYGTGCKANTVLFRNI